jgi:hypothetical protein
MIFSFFHLISFQYGKHFWATLTRKVQLRHDAWMTENRDTASHWEVVARQTMKRKFDALPVDE